MNGKVYLIGAGPGDYQLLTMKACACLKKADVVVYDRLADDRILQYAPQEAEFIYVGKASSQHTMPQEQINQLLVDLAKDGKTVVRLKGGDPFVFGRGGEEALLLQENGIAFEIVPGVTSAISVPAYAGIPVTHRGVAASFAVVTGHEDPTKPDSDIHWQQLATATDTLVFLMGVANLPRITARLIENGRSGDTPAAIIRWGTKKNQQAWTTTVAEAAAMVKRENIKPPCIFIVGNVVNLRKELAWFDNPAMKPLFGKRIVVTRARNQASKLTQGLEELGAEFLEAPTIRIVPPADNGKAVDKAIAKLPDFDWVIFTSVNGVKFFFEGLCRAGLDSRALAGLSVCAIGSGTAEALAGHGIKADVVPESFTAEGIIAALYGKAKAGDKILLPRAAEARNVLPEELTNQGMEVEAVTAYETITADTDSEALAKEFAEHNIDMVTFTSSSTVKNLIKLLGDNAADLLRGVRIAAIGPVTAETCRRHGLEVAVQAGEYTIAGLIEAIKEGF